MRPSGPVQVVQRLGTVLENERIARDTYRLRLEVPEIARAILPGQFVMVRAVTTTDPLLGRPFALYDVVRDREGLPVAIDVVYLVIGRGTSALAERRPGERLSVWGPLGNHFGPAPDGPVAFVAGGIGQTPFLALARKWLGQAAYGPDAGDVQSPVESARLFYGVRNASLLAGLDDFRSTGIAVEVATDDGSAGHHGFVTDLVAARLDSGERWARLVGCGPPPMLATLARLAERHRVPCDVSLENHMACGFGACFSCVCPIRQTDGSTDLRRVCVEGPIFDARDVAFTDRCAEKLTLR